MPDQRPILRRIALIAYFLLAVLVFLFFLFPFDRLKTRLEAEVRQKTPLELSIGHVSPRFFNRFVLNDVVVSSKSGTVLFEAPSIRTTFSLLNLLRNVLSLNLRAAAYGGETSLRVRQEKGKLSLRIDADGLDISSYSLLKQQGFKLAGAVGGNFEMDGDQGKGKLWVKGLASRELKVMGFSVPDLDFEQGWMEGELRGDRLMIKKLELDGKELKLRASGDVVVRTQGALNLSVRIKPSERLAREQSALFSLLKIKDAEGFYTVALGGTIDRPLPRL